MPQIPYKAKRSHAYPPTRKLPHGATGTPKADEVAVSLTDLANYAVGVGDLSVFGSTQSRPWVELVWRASMARSSLDVSRWVLRKEPVVRPPRPQRKICC